MTDRLAAADVNAPEPSPAAAGRHEAVSPPTDAKPAKNASPRLRGPSRLLMVALFLAVLLCGAWLSDDAYISFRAADNLVHGYGLTWNVEERVQAFTNPLWTLLFAAIYGLTHEVFYTAIFLSVAVSATAVAWYAGKIAQTRSAAALGVLVLTVSMAFVDYSTSGLENPLTHLLLVLFLWLYLTRGDCPDFCGGHHAAAWSPQKWDCPLSAPSAGTAGEEGKSSGGERGLASAALPGALSLLAALAAVNRMDSILLFLPALLYVLAKRRTWQSLGWMALGSLPLWLWMGFSLVYYGFPFPNTAYAKLNNGIPAGALAAQGCYYLWNSLKSDPLTLTTIIFALGFACWRRRWRELAVAMGIFLYLLYIVKIGGDFMSGRYLAAPLLAAVCLLGTLPWTARTAWAPALAVIVLLGVYGCRPLMRRSEANFSWEVCWPRIAAEHGVCDEAAYYAAAEMGLPTQLANGLHVRFKDCEWVMTSRALRLFVTTRGEKPVNVYNCIGRYGYYAGPDVFIVDGCALSDPLLARLPPIPDPFWRIGHFRRATPDGYVATLRTGKNLLCDPGTAEYYDHLRLITRGGLWDRGRWAAIWNMNLGRYEGLLQEARREIRMMLPYHEIALPDKLERLEKIDRRIALHPDDAAACRYRGALYAAKKEPDKAIRDFSRALELQPENVFTYCNRGTLYVQQGAWEKAVADFNRAIALKPGLAAAYDGRGAAYAKGKQFQQGRKDFQRAAELDPGETRTYYSRGMAYKDMRDWQPAFDDFRQFIAWDPVEPGGYYGMACALAATHNLEAVYELEKPPHDFSSEALTRLAWILATHPDAKYRNGAQALRYVQEAMEIQSERSAWLLRVLAASYAEAGDFPKAVDAARQALRLARIQDRPRTVQDLQRELLLYETGQPSHVAPSGSSPR